jgi:hypothetical protein
MRLNFSKVRDRPDRDHCPECGTTCRIFTVKKDGPRKGWSFVKCRGCDPIDPVFRWVETFDRLTSDQKRAIRRDLQILLGECDGAHSRDDVGFNGRDAPIASRYASDLREGIKIDWVSLAAMLKKYRKTQLGGHNDY